MPIASRTSTSGVSADNIIEGSRKRAKLESDAGNGLAQSPAISTSRLPDGGGVLQGGGGAEVATSLGFKMLDVLINRIDQDNQPLTVPFLALPSRADYPDYYEMIKNPISLEQIRRRLQNREYESFEQVRNALESICRNAKRYNLKGSEIYEKSRIMHQIILHAYIDLVEKGDVQPVGGFILKSEPPLQEQSARLAKLEKPTRRARLDYDEVDEGEADGKVSLRLKKDDDIVYEEDGEEGNEPAAIDRQVTEEKSVGDSTENQMTQPVASSVPPRAKEERRTPQIERSMDPDETDEGNMSTSHIFDDGDIEMLDGRPLDRSMLTLAGKFDRRKRPGPRGKRLKSTLRNLVVELIAAVDQQNQPITRYFRTLPSRLQYPDYYKVIQRPIALDSIEDKVHKKGYANPYALIAELRQMVDNAQYYNEEGSEVWEAAEQVRQYIEGTTIPTLLADGFTLDPKDMRQSALPVEIAANSSVPAQAAAYRIQMERRKALENGTSNEYMDSVSPELPARSLGPPNYDKLKVRLHPRGSNHAAPALSDMQPPPPSVALGLSVSDPASQMMAPRGSYGQAMPSQGMYPPAMPGSAPPPSSYLAGMGSGLPHPLPPAAANVWPNGSPAASNSMYPGQYGYSPSPQTGTRPASTMMLPPGAPNYSNGSLPFQKPTAVQLLGSPGQPPVGEGDAGKSSQNLSKRLPGDAPTFDAFQTNVLRVDENTLIVRQALISLFGLQIRGKDGYQTALRYSFRNDVTRIHSVSILSHPPELLECRVHLVPQKRARKEGRSFEETEEKPWTVSIHHNGRGIRPQWENQDANGAPIEEITVATTNGATPAPTSMRVQMPPGTPCHFAFTPYPGANVLSINIHPPPANPALQDIVKDDKHPLRSKAKQLLELPEKYRLLIYCQS